MYRLRRRQCLSGMIALAGCRPPRGAGVAPPPAAPTATEDPRLRADYDRLCAFVRDTYCFFGDKATDWDAAVAHWRPAATGAADASAFMHAIEGLLDELYDPHCMLGANDDASWRPVPFDVWPTWVEGAAVVTAVRRGSSAAGAGLRPGDEIVAIDGRPIDAIVDARRPHALRRPDPAAEQWALLSAVTGRHGDPRRCQIRRGEDARVFELGHALDDGPLVEGRRIEADLGLVRIASFGDDRAIDAFDEALASLQDTAGLLVDVRANAGGDTAIARPIMGRFIHDRSRYAAMARREGEGLGERWPEYVAPRGPFTYDAPVVVLVDRFSVSMAEGFAIGMHGMGRAHVVGTAMAGLGAAIARIHLPNVDLVAQISAEPVYHVDGTPRWKWHPDVEVDPLAPGDDPILAQGIETLRTDIAQRR